MVSLIDNIAPGFYGLHNIIKSDEHTHYWTQGGRGSTKSSFISLEIIQGIVADPNANAVIFRKHKTNLRTSVYAMMKWAVQTLGLSQYFRFNVSPLCITYKPTGQRIEFYGLDDPTKMKSAKFENGYAKYLWYEEVEEFLGIQELRKNNQTFMRGGDIFKVFYSYNPPQSMATWVNQEQNRASNSRKLLHYSNYLTVPRNWLGNEFFIEAEDLKQTDPEAYKHEYLGVITGTGGEIFRNVEIRRITSKERLNFQYIREGIDWGYAIDPFAWVQLHYDQKRRILCIFNEITGVGLLNDEAFARIKPFRESNHIIADSAEPKSIIEMQLQGLPGVGAKKGPDSVRTGIKGLQRCRKIVIDPERCPRSVKEFTSYEYKRLKDGTFRADYPDENNHCIDAVRYAMEDIFNCQVSSLDITRSRY